MIKFYLIILILFLLCHSLTLSADKSDQLRIEVLTEQYPPFSYEKNGVIGGISTEVVINLFAELGIHPDIRVMRWSRAYRRALRNEDVLIYSLARTPEREDLFHWIGIVAPFDIYLYSLSEREDIQVSNFDDLEKYTVGVVHGDTRDEYFSSISKIPVRRYSNSKRLVEALIRKEIDLLPAAEQNFPYVLEHLGYSHQDFAQVFFCDDLSEDGLYMALSKKTATETVELMKKTYQKIVAEQK